MERLWSRTTRERSRESPVILDRLPAYCRELIGSSLRDRLQVVENADVRSIRHCLIRNRKTSEHEGHEAFFVTFLFVFAGSQYIMAT